MGWLSIPLSVATVTVASIVFGIVVDDTIHFLHRLKAATGKSEKAVVHIHETVHYAGPAMVISSIVSGVITSYSIHYTKLYDVVLGNAADALTSGAKKDIELPIPKAYIKRPLHLQIVRTNPDDPERKPIILASFPVPSFQEAKP